MVLASDKTFGFWTFGFQINVWEWDRCLTSEIRTCLDFGHSLYRISPWAFEPFSSVGVVSLHLVSKLEFVAEVNSGGHWINFKNVQF